MSRRNFFAPPVFEDEEKSRLAALLNDILLIYIALTVLGCLIILLFATPFPQYRENAFTGLAFAAILIGLYFLLRRGYVTFANWVLLITNIIIVTIAVYNLRTIQAIQVSAFFVIIALATLLLGPRAGVSILLLSSFIVFSLMLLKQSSGSEAIKISAFNQWVAFTILASIIAALTSIIYKHVNHALKNARALAAERSRMEQALRASEAQYRLIADYATDMISRHTPEGLYIYASPACEHLLGYKSEELVGHSAYEFIPKDDRFVIQNAHQQILNSTQIPSAIYQARRRDGSLVWMETTSQSIRDPESGEVRELIAITRDIGARKRMEDAIVNERQLLRTIIDHLPLAVYVKDIQGSKTLSNPFDVAFIGAENEAELLGKTDYDTFPRHLADQYTADDHLVLSGQSVINREEQSIDGAGRQRWVLTSKIPLRNAQGEITGLVGTGIDITEQKHALQALQESEERYRRLVEILPDGVVIHSGGIIRWVNQAALKLIGAEAPEQLTGLRAIDLVHPDYRQIAMQRIQRALQRDEPAPAIEEKFLRLDGTAIDVEVDAIAFNHEGQPAMLTVVRDISVRKQMENAVANERQLMRTVIDHLPIGVYVKDLQGRKTLSNPFDVTFVGAESEAELLGKTDYDTFPSYLADRYTADDNLVLSGQSVLNREEPCVDYVGRLRWLMTSKIPLRNAQGEIIGLVGTGRDITEQKYALQALQESEERFRNIIHASPMGIHMYELQPDDRLVFIGANPAADRILGVDNSIFIGKTIEEAFPPLSETETPECYRRAAANGTLWQTEQISYQDEKIVGAFEVYAFQTSPGRMAAMFLDVTERKQMLEELRRLRNLLGNIINSMPSVLIGVDPDGKVSQWNARAAQITGIEAAQAIGQPLARVYPILSNQIDNIHKAIRKKQTYSTARVPYRMGEDTGYQDITIYPLVTNGIEGAVIRVDDVSERVRLEEIMVQSEKMLSVGGLAAGMAHEINNPLAGILQNAEILANRLTGDFPANRKIAEEIGLDMQMLGAYLEKRKIITLLQYIRESGSRAAKIVQNMLSFARKSQVAFSSHNLDVLLDQTVELAQNDYDLKKKYDFRGIQIVRQYESAPPVPCEDTQIQQVFLNIFRNSAEALHQFRQECPSEWQPSLTLRVQNDNDLVCAEIEDNGPGMDENVRRRIFEPFFTTKSVGSGSGLGLAVAYFIIKEVHHGSLTVESIPGKGSKFIICLPIKQEQEEERD